MRCHLIIQSTKNWQQVRGVIKTASIGVMRGRFGADHEYDSVNYSYSVNNRSYNGDRASLSFFRGPVLEDPKGYKSGQSISVYYNPKNPSQSVLELPKQNESFAPALIIILSVCTVGVWFVSKYGYFS